MSYLFLPLSVAEPPSVGASGPPLAPCLSGSCGSFVPTVPAVTPDVDI